MSSPRTNSGHVLQAVKDLSQNLETQTFLLNNLTDEVATLKYAVDGMLPDSNKEDSMSSSIPADFDINQFMPQIAAAMAANQQAPAQPAQQAQPNFEAMVNKALDAKMDAVVDRVMEAQNAGKSFWTSPVFIGCVAGGILLVIGGTLYYMNQRLNTLEEINVK